MVRQHHWLNGCELEQTPGDSRGQQSLLCCSPWGHRVRHDNSKTTMAKQVECLFMCLFSICKSSLRNYLLKSFTQFFFELFVAFLLSCELYVYACIYMCVYMYIFRIQYSIGYVICGYFPPVCSQSFHLLLFLAKVLNFDKVKLINFQYYGL